MEKIVECVPNFSTANPVAIDKIAQAVEGVNGVRLLDVDPDADYNRVVFTFVGHPEVIGEAAFQAIKAATEAIDMTTHSGEHPRLGATDVCPFIPISGVSFDECIELSKQLGKRIGNDLNLPVYLYGMAATSDDRVKLSSIRKGEYEGLEEKIKQPEWKPDYGPAEFVPKSGAVVTGVRDFLIAYNINLETTDVALANEIAGIVRESGRWVEKDGERVREPGLFKGIQAMGVTLERPNRTLTQVSMNVLNFRELTSLHEIFEGVKKVAEEKGTKVTGSELVGLIPQEAMLMAAKYYDESVSELGDQLDLVISTLGLSDLEEFSPKKKVIELMINSDNLVDLTITRFLRQLSSSSPAPGGGSVSALGGSLAASLATMVANLSTSDKYADVASTIASVQAKAVPIRNKLTKLIDADTEAFNRLMAAFRMSKDDPDRRSKAIQAATIGATEIPLQVAKLSLDLFDLLDNVVESGNQNAVTDAGVGALFAASAVKGALYNMQINLLGIKDEAIKSDFQKQVKSLLSDVETKLSSIEQKIHQKIDLNLD